MINTNKLIQEFKSSDFTYAVENNPLNKLQYRSYFPTLFRDDLTFGTLSSEASASVMADIVAIGSKAPRKGRETVKALTGEIPKVEIAFDLTEKDMMDIRKLRNAANNFPGNSSLKDQLIDKIYEDAGRCVSGVHARMEWAAKQLASQGSFETTVDNNAGGLAKVKIDFGVSSGNASFNWFANDVNFETGRPLTDIRTKYDVSVASGRAFAYMFMDRITFNQLVKFKEVQQYAASFSQAVSGNYQIPSLIQLNTALAVQGLPTIVIWDSYVSAEKKTGVKDTLSGWVTGNILFSFSNTLGDTQYTITDEFNNMFPDVMSQAVNNDFILVKTFGSQDPIIVSTKGVALAVPVLRDPKKISILKTKLA